MHPDAIETDYGRARGERRKPPRDVEVRVQSPGDGAESAPFVEIAEQDMESAARGAAKLEQFLRLQRTLARAHPEMQRHELQRDAVRDDMGFEHDARAIAVQRD